MSMMEQGGLLTGNAEVDPISGNEVPPGARPEEVRDDIPAMLSESEYVVPADVLRYFGVAFFEDLRAQAKEGLARMDADGRIGGEPMPMEDDVLPFSPEELQVLGGDMDGQMMASGMAAGGMTRGYNEGGSVAPRTTYMPAFQQRFGTVGGSLFQPVGGPALTTPAATGETETIMYVNDRGNMIAITFIDGVPQQEIPQGFRPLGETAAPEVTPIGEGGGGAMWSDGMTAAEIRDAQARGDFTPKGQTPSKSFADFTAEDWANWNPTAGQRMGTLLGGVVGGIMTQSPAGARLGARGMEALMGRSTITGYKELNDFIGKLDINDPLYSELTSKRDDLYSELVEANQESQGFLGRIMSDIFGLSRPEIPAPTTGIRSTTATAPLPSSSITGTGPFVEDYTTMRDPRQTTFSETARSVSVPGHTPSDRALSTPATAPAARPAPSFDYTAGARDGQTTFSETARSVGVPGHTASAQAASTPSVAPAPSPSRGAAPSQGTGATGGQPTVQNRGGLIGRARGGLMGNPKPKTPNRKARRAAKKKSK